MLEATVVDLALARPPLVGRTRLVCIDGPACSGKTTLAEVLVAECARRDLSVALVHMDDVYDGWGGLAKAGEQLARSVVDPLSRGEAGRYRCYDWHRGEYAEEVPVPPTDVLVVEGVGSGHLGYADRITALVFIDAPQDTRFARGMGRDGAWLEPHWVQWTLDETELHTAERTRSRAHVLVDSVTGRLSVVRDTDA